MSNASNATNFGCLSVVYLSRSIWTRKRTRKAPENYFLPCFLSTQKFLVILISRQVTGASSQAFENVFGKLVGDKMAATGEHFLKGLFHQIIKWLVDRFRAEMIKRNNYTDRKFSECRYILDRSAGETIFFELLGSGKSLIKSSQIQLKLFSCQSACFKWFVL